MMPCVSDRCQKNEQGHALRDEMEKMDTCPTGDRKKHNSREGYPMACCNQCLMRHCVDGHSCSADADMKR